MSVSSNIHDENSRNLLRKEVPCDSEIESPMDDEEFPTTSIRVLLVDEDSDSLLLMENLMTRYSYQVTKYENGEEAIDFLMKSKHEIDLVIWDFHMPDINGVDALNTIGKDMDLPVVIMSHGYKKETVMKSTKFGACDFLVKPVSKEIIAVLWRHVFCKRLSKSGLDKPDESDTVESIPDEDENLRQEKYNDLCQSNEEGSKNTSDRKREKSSPKKPRMAWTAELHHKFEVAVEKIGSVDKAFPKQILKYMQEEMNVQGLTRNNVASHLQRLRWQKYRLNVNNKQTRIPQETQEDSGWRVLAASNPLLNSSINQDARASYFMNDQAVVNAPIQYSSNSYLPMNNHYYIPNPLPYIDQYQQRQQQFYSSLQLPPLLTKQESGHVSYTMENSDPLIYNTPTLSDLHECFNFDQIGR